MDTKTRTTAISEWFKKVSPKKVLARSYLALVLLILYAPIFYMVFFSFMDVRFMGMDGNFTFDNYRFMFNDPTLRRALRNTLIITLTSATIATILGTLGAIGIFYMNRNPKRVMLFGNQINVVNPEVVTAMGLFLFFTVAFMPLGDLILPHNFAFGFVTIIIGHVALCTPFVVLNILPRLRRINPNNYEAALDLGASPFHALRRVIIPEIFPAMLGAFVLSITLSLDDFLITRFNSGVVETLSLYIYSAARFGNAETMGAIRALATVMFVGAISIIAIGTLAQNRLARSKFKKT
ncbi:MAG: ABC transporter permease [Firmicutes bacterium]|nr:ABC transporter permease [Bacillota bacterium]